MEVGDDRIRLTTAEDIEALIGRLSSDAFNVDERLPYWAELWHSAVALSAVLIEQEDTLRGVDAVEIGCGLGLPGIIAASRGANMTFVDYDEFALAAVELNLRTNVPGVAAEFLPLDFRVPPSRSWPLILAADVIYEQRFIEPLAEFLQRTLAPGGRILLAEPNRIIAAPFFDALETRGFRYTRQSRFADLHGRLAEVSVYEIRRKRG